MNRWVKIAFRTRRHSSGLHEKYSSHTSAAQILVDCTFSKSLTMLEVAIEEIEQDTEQSDVVLELLFFLIALIHEI